MSKLKCAACGNDMWYDGHKEDCPHYTPPLSIEQFNAAMTSVYFDCKKGVIPVTNETKPSNPKDLIGSNKVPYHFWPETATVLGAMACMYGNLQYGRTNWRAAGVRASIYYDALRRHMNAWFDAGEDTDPDSGLPHLAHALACIAIIVDAQAAGKLTDDRMVKGGYRALIDEMTAHVPRLKEKFKGKDPKHYTIADNEEVK